MGLAATGLCVAMRKPEQQQSKTTATDVDNNWLDIKPKFTLQRPTDLLPFYGERRSTHNPVRGL
jgi:hypothetical protein